MLYVRINDLKFYIYFNHDKCVFCYRVSILSDFHFDTASINECSRHLSFNIQQKSAQWSVMIYGARFVWILTHPTSYRILPNLQHGQSLPLLQCPSRLLFLQELLMILLPLIEGPHLLYWRETILFFILISQRFHHLFCKFLLFFWTVK